MDAVLCSDPAARGLLRADEVLGLRLFIGKAQCVSCHNGPLFSDPRFHNTSVPPRDGARPDRLHLGHLELLQGDGFITLR